ncbi:hypothetical protein DMENIID0001_054340 [Sergentomyia squamirostris]
MNIRFLTKSQVKQCLVTVCVNFSFLNYCFTIGWLSNAITVYTSEHSPLSTGPLTTSQISLMSSVVFLTAIPGSLLFGRLSDWIGRKWSLYLGNIIYTMGFLLLALATNYEMIVVARALNGLGMGCAFVVTQIYVSEIAEKEIRGILGAVYNSTVSLGSLLARLICIFVDISGQSYIFIGTNVICWISFCSRYTSIFAPSWTIRGC